MPPAIHLSILRRQLNCVLTLALLVVAAAVLLSIPAPARADSEPTDVMFVVDTTGSMTDALAEAKDQLSEAVATLSDRYSDLHVGLSEVRDYGDVYGDPGDEPWSLTLPMTADRARLQTAIDDLYAENGGDPPEAYGRALFEADTNPSIGWRPGARRLLVLVADNVPHDDELNEGIPADDQLADSPFDTGIDPGPDDEVGTADDIDWQRLLEKLKADGLPLLFVFYHGEPTYLPYWSDWAGSTGGRAGNSDDGDLGSTITDLINDSTTACSRSGKSIGLVSVCADEIAADGSSYVARGNVVLDGGVGVGDGPLTLNPNDKTITSEGIVGVSVRRGDVPIQVGSGVLAVNAAGEQEAISARKFAKLTLSGFTAGPLPNLGGVGIGFDPVPTQDLFLDDAGGGGVVAPLAPGFDLFGARADGKLAVGVYATGAPVRVLGGSLGWGGKDLPGGWKIASLNVAYSSGDDRWSLSGGASFPFFKGIGGVDVEGSLTGGKIDVIGLVVHTRVPLANTGFVFDSFGGKLAGLAGGPGNPLRITASTSGYYGVLPKPIDHIFWLKSAQLTIDTSGGASLGGEATFGTADGRFVKGTVDLGFRVQPFSAGGKAKVEARALGLDAVLNGSAAATSNHFTAAGGMRGSFKGITLASADGIVSDRGIGGVAHLPRVCVWEPFGGTHCTPGYIGFGATWSELPNVRAIGDNLGEFRTARMAKKPNLRFRVPRGKPFLFVDGVGTTAPPEFVLVDPSGRRYRTTKPGGAIKVTRNGELKSTSVSVSAPRPGRWKVVAAGNERVKWTLEAARRVQPLTAKLNVSSSRRHRLSKSAVRHVRVRWRSDLGRGVRVTAFVSRSKRSLGLRLRSGLRGSGSIKIPARKLRKGANFVHLVATTRGAGLDRTVTAAIWR